MGCTNNAPAFILPFLLGMNVSITKKKSFVQNGEGDIPLR